MGIVQLEWNTTGDLLLVRFGAKFSCFKNSRHSDPIHPENVPAVAHVFDFPSPQEDFIPRLRSVLIHSQPVLNARWNPVRKGSLLLCCGTQSVYTWSDEWVNENGEEEETAECIGVPAGELMTSFLIPMSDILLFSARKIRDEGYQMVTRWQRLYPI